MDMNNPPAPDGNRRVQPPEEQTLRRARSLILVGNIAGPVSLFIGGILLGIAGIVCACIARGSVKPIAARAGAFQPSARMMQRSATIAIVLCAACIAINVITAIVLFPEIMAAVESGDLASLGMGGATAGVTSTWG